MHVHAIIAIRAATLRYRNNIGAYSSRRYAEARLPASQMRLYFLACQLAALEFFGR